VSNAEQSSSNYYAAWHQRILSIYVMVILTCEGITDVSRYYAAKRKLHK
jgi:hypothetical protein